MIKVLLIGEILSSYRLPIYELMAQSVNLDLAYIVKKELVNCKIKSFKLSSRKIKNFILLEDYERVFEQYDVVIYPPHLKFPQLVILPLRKRKFKVIPWSIGMYVSYDRKFDLTRKLTLKDWVFGQIMKQSDATIMYMPQSIPYWVEHLHVNPDKYFVAHNTVKVADFKELPLFETRNYILFVGTLYKQKGIGELIEAYSKAKDQVGKLPKLLIIGKGPEEDAIKEMVSALNLDTNVNLLGAIYDEKVLKDYFLQSIICVSPKQAGLSVLKSLGYGVPFVTRTDAITGGEIFNIKNCENGYLYDTFDELVEIIKNTVLKKDTFANMSSNARDYYLSEAYPEKMAKGVIDAISYVMGH